MTNEQRTTREVGAVPGAAELADRIAIQDVLVQHSRAVDRADGALLKAAYWPEATVAYGGFNGNAHEFCAALPAAIRTFARTRHCISNVAVELRDDEARVESYVTAYHYTSNDHGPDHEMTYLGRYLDRMQKRRDVWKILHRQVVMDWNQHTTATAVWSGPPFDGLATGDRYPDDPLYRLLGR